MTLDEAIAHAELVASTNCNDACKADHKQLVVWLKELSAMKQGAEPVAWTIQAQLDHLKKPGYSEMPMAMWSTPHNYAKANIPLYRHRAPASAGKDAWQPIETAPKDGTLILAHLPDSDSCYVIGWCDKTKDIRSYFNADGWCIAWDGESLPNRSQPTHWMPLPAAPNAAMKGGA